MASAQVPRTNEMGEPTQHDPVLLILAAFSRHDDALEWGWRTASSQWGAVALSSDAFEFAATDYYSATMGCGLRKQFFAFGRLVHPGCLVDAKLQTNAWEVEYAERSQHPEPRPLNLDPGYLTLGKLVLASTKDYAHRIYLEKGIFAEITLNYRHHRWQPHEFTFPDYRRADYHAFFSRCRDYLKQAARRPHD
jgi:hypothetical protein